MAIEYVDQEGHRITVPRGWIVLTLALAAWGVVSIVGLSIWGLIGLIS